MKKTVGVQSDHGPPQGIGPAVSVVNEWHVGRQFKFRLADYWDVIKSKSANLVHALKKVRVMVNLLSI